MGTQDSESPSAKVKEFVEDMDVLGLEIMTRRCQRLLPWSICLTSSEDITKIIVLGVQTLPIWYLHSKDIT